jgi:DUF1009 family protein
VKIALICGGGILPRDVAQALLRQQADFVVIRLAGEADTDLELPDSIQQITIGWGQIGRFFRFLEDQSCTHVLAVGGVTKRPDFSSLKLDLGGIKALPEAIATVIGGDDKVLSNVASVFEKRGYQVIGVLQAVPEMSCPLGHVSSNTPDNKAIDDINLAIRAAQAAGALDMGQGAVAADNRVIAMEGPEGTRDMLERVATIRRQKRARWKNGQGVLVKCAKPGQDIRFDVPVIGPDTVHQVKAAGLAGIAVEAGHVLLLDRENLLRVASQEGIFIQGISLVQSGNEI